MIFLLLDPGAASRMFPLRTVILGYMTVGRYSLIAADEHAVPRTRIRGHPFGTTPGGGAFFMTSLVEDESGRLRVENAF